ncbi:MAG: undecaprenyldiphospho-muramoylpentapeptide beta-N-acetylglucosaminyltransferase [Deltaproteobacteria bacterium]|nr:undecaprenyldiphospho-muramoylpentapeptide beta-N-acetylglucosaminyltransferase [Deltaproteobacteria bacterium]
MKDSQFKVVIAGGGTGGHIIPAIAVADEIVSRGGHVRFIGTKGRIEERLVPLAGYGIDFTKVKPLTGGGIGRKISGAASIPLSLARSRTLLKKLSPDFVLGVGGYVAGPVVMAARLMGIKTAFLEQNAIIGLTNKLLKPFVQRAFVSYESSLQEFRGDVAIYTGNPVKKSILEAAALKKEQAKDGHKKKKINILVMGGSQGAGSIDEKVPKAIALAEVAKQVKVLHQGKEDNMEAVAAAYKEGKIDAVVTTFIDDTAKAFLNADFIIARSGATTVSELTVMGLPAIFLPYPWHKDNQQYKNAIPMMENGAAVVLDEKTTGIDELRDAISRFVNKNDVLEKAAAASANIGKPDAAKKIADEIIRLIG